MNAQMIHQTVVEVRYADPPREGKKRATIKTPAGELYFLKPEHLGLFQKGRRYRVDYTEQPWQGRQIRTIVKVEPEAAPSNSTHQASTAGTGDAPGAGEVEFVTRCLAAAISSCSVGQTHEEIVKRIQLYRAAFHEGFK